MDSAPDTTRKADMSPLFSGWSLRSCNAGAAVRTGHIEPSLFSFVPANNILASRTQARLHTGAVERYAAA
jgi:hypothetical protein